MCSAEDSMERICPVPWQRGQADVTRFAQRKSADADGTVQQSKREILQVCTRARSYRNASRSRFSTSAGCGRFHVDEVDDDEAAQIRNRNWRAISSAASRLVRSRSPRCRRRGWHAPSHIDRHQWLRVIDHHCQPPEGRGTWRE